MQERKADISRVTGETNVHIAIDLDGTGKADIHTGIGFFDHMLNSFARHGLFDLTVDVKGDLEVDSHHTIEDTGIVLGQAIRQAVGVIGPAIRPKAGRARHHRAGAARRRAVLAALGLAVCRRCSMARRSAVCWHRAGGRRWHGMQQAGRRGTGRCRWCAAGAGCCRRCSVSGPAERAKKKKAGAAARCASVVPAFSAAVVAPVQGCFCRLQEGSDSSLNGISLQW